MPSDPPAIDPSDLPTVHDARATLRGGVAIEPLPDDDATDELELRRPIGRGGMAEVWLAHDPVLGREVAVKRLLPERSSDREPLRREARIAGRLEHPNIIPIHTLQDEETGPCIVMKRVEGVAWSRILTGEHPPPEGSTGDRTVWNLRVLIQVCRAVEFAHSRGILHRDLKPANVMVGAFGEVYLLDWGIALSLEPDPTGRLPDRRSAIGISGTPLYMPPEMFDGDAERQCPQSDVYQLAGMLHEVLHGDPPRKRGPMLTLILASLKAPKLAAGSPEELVPLMQESLAVCPDERPTAAQFRRRLEQYLERREWIGLRDRNRDRVALLGTLSDEEVEEGWVACRFAFDTVLEHMPDDGPTLAARDTLFVFMIERALDAGHPREAKTLIDSLHTVPEDLRVRVDEAYASWEEVEARLAHLEVDLSNRTGTTARVVFFGLLTATWVFLPVTLGLLGWERNLSRIVIQNTTLLVSLTVATLVLWPWLRRSRLNRGVVALLFLSPAIGNAVALVGWITDAGDVSVTAFRALWDAGLLLVGGMLLDVRVLPGGLVYLLAAVAVAAWPHRATPILASATGFAVVSLTAAWMISAARSAPPS